jgi:hypothetical protein
MYRQQTLELIEKCLEAESNGFSPEEIRFEILPVLMKPILESSGDFLTWVRESPEYSYFYFDIQERGVCAKPVEAAAMIIEAIVGFDD